MWLINTSTLSLELYYGDEIPAYAILSHTWGDGEMSFQEFTQATETKNDGTKSKAGYRKIAATCDRALMDGYCYAWVDTCCIDKTSSAELTEAINSMFGWYRQSQVCYVYLSDFMLDTADVTSQQDQFDANFRQCRWFTRGWCLQELLAPRHLRFFNQKWQEIGAKSSLSRLISDITGVPEAVLLVPPKKDIQEFPIAARISWIAKRHTTRIEDMSYSLLGILNVNMPMLYGEGQKAFLRLQEEIIKKYNDLSIFAWNGAATASGFMPILAASPASFVINPIDHQSRDSGSQLGERLRTQFSLTNQGVFFPSAKLQYQVAVPGYRHHYLLNLNYQDPSFQGRGGNRRYILLQKIGPGLFIRLHDPPDRLKAFQKTVPTGAFFEPVCILNNPLGPMIRQLVLWERYALRLRWKPWGKLGRRYWHIRTVQPKESWDLAASQFLLEMVYERHMHIEFVPGNYESNPSFKYFVLVVQVGDKNIRDPAMVSVRIVSADVWEGINVPMSGFRKKEALALETLPPMKGTGDSDHISLVGYDISVSVRLVTEPNEQPYHIVYLDWEAATSLSVTNE
ncbi:uncharacterized protein PAC_09321 [Phialocephala subalpina]|uniref:Uncharacterized protein n=1 Tax=Phialocephala subalpina TaxID=576137 RepID=A0A1L7X329_9HELO|nr:uncharacterized protein PAC_09321 [Phialocephala subalpina]